MIFYKIKR